MRSLLACQYRTENLSFQWRFLTQAFAGVSPRETVVEKRLWGGLIPAYEGFKRKMILLGARSLLACKYRTENLSLKLNRKMILLGLEPRT